MAEEKKQNQAQEVKTEAKPEQKDDKLKSVSAKRIRKKNSSFKKNVKKDEFEQRILDLARVTRVMAGGKRMRFRACVAIGDKKGQVGVAMGKGADVSIAVQKAVNRARKALICVPIINDTIPHAVKQKFGASVVLFKPGKDGRGVIAGGIVRVILELAGIKNITCKIIGTNNKVTNAKCTIKALESLKRIEIKEDKNKKINVEEKKEKKDDKKDDKKVEKKSNLAKVKNEDKKSKTIKKVVKKEEK